MSEEINFIQELFIIFFSKCKDLWQYLDYTPEIIRNIIPNTEYIGIGRYNWELDAY